MKLAKDQSSTPTSVPAMAQTRLYGPGQPGGRRPPAADQIPTPEAF